MNELAAVEIGKDFSIKHPTYGDLTMGVKAELEAILEEERALASIERLEIAKANRRIGNRRVMEFGEIVATIPAVDFHQQEALEPGCWTDEGFIEEAVKRVPEWKVTSKTDKISIINPGLHGLN